MSKKRVVTFEHLFKYATDGVMAMLNTRPAGPTAPAEDRCEVIAVDSARVSRLKPQLPDVAPVAQLFKLLGDETRAGILSALAKEEMCVCDLAALLGRSVSNVSHHLRLLRGARLVRYRKEGKQVIYALDDEHVQNLIQAGIEHAGHTQTRG